MAVEHHRPCWRTFDRSRSPLEHPVFPRGMIGAVAVPVDGPVAVPVPVVASCLPSMMVWLWVADTLGLSVYHVHATTTAYAQGLRDSTAIGRLLCPESRRYPFDFVRIGTTEITVTLPVFPVIVVKNKYPFGCVIGVVRKIGTTLALVPHGIIRATTHQRRFNGLFQFKIGLNLVCLVNVRDCVPFRGPVVPLDSIVKRRNQ